MVHIVTLASAETDQTLADPENNLRNVLESPVMCDKLVTSSFFTLFVVRHISHLASNP